MCAKIKKNNSGAKGLISSKFFDGFSKKKYRNIKFHVKQFSGSRSCNMRTDRQTITKLIVVFRNFANAPDNGLSFHLLPNPEGRTDPRKLVRWSMSEKCLKAPAQWSAREGEVATNEGV